MNYGETEQKIILREMERDILALVALDLNDGSYEVIYSDGAYKQFDNRYRRENFFEAWKNTGCSLIFEPDRARMASEISMENLRKVFEKEDSFITRCRFFVNDSPTWCRIKIIRNPVESGTVVMGIRNIDAELKLELDRMAEMEEKLRKEEEMNELREKLKQMRINNFISQMHPHFLYNALGSIREIVLTDPEYGADLLYDFTTHLRASIRAMSNDSSILFSQELENIHAYINIEKMRFGDDLKVEYDIKTDDDFKIIPLSIQPIVENAVKHGIYEKESGAGTVIISTAELEDCLEIRVTDDGVGFDPEKIRRDVIAGRRDSTGLDNLIFRLKNMMNAKVNIKSAVGAGTSVTIRIPKTYEC